MESKGMRMDVWLVEQGFASGREKAKELLSEGYVQINGCPVIKASRRVLPGERVACAAPPAKYVGRGGYKLEKAVMAVGLQLAGKTAMDIGSSTGGFTDCLLQNGAAHVIAVDVGHNQLHPSLREDNRVTVLEGTDVRSPALAQAVPVGSVDVCSVDVSFVSLEHVLPAVLPYLTADAVAVCLIKPQFEAGRSGIGKRGVVRDRKVHRQVLAAQLELFHQLYLTPVWMSYSPITGGEGNIEYITVLSRRSDLTPAVIDPAALVDAAFSELT